MYPTIFPWEINYPADIPAKISVFGIETYLAQQYITLVCWSLHYDRNTQFSATMSFIIFLERFTIQQSTWTFCDQKFACRARRNYSLTFLRPTSIFGLLDASMWFSVTFTRTFPSFLQPLIANHTDIRTLQTTTQPHTYYGLTHLYITTLAEYQYRAASRRTSLVI